MLLPNPSTNNRYAATRSSAAAEGKGFSRKYALLCAAKSNARKHKGRTRWARSCVFFVAGFEMSHPAAGPGAAMTEGGRCQVRSKWMEAASSKGFVDAQGAVAHKPSGRLLLFRRVK
eukprot:799848-Rhodomonas_salina.1